jgi:hypothetical protein
MRTARPRTTMGGWLLRALRRVGRESCPSEGPGQGPGVTPIGLSGPAPSESAAEELESLGSCLGDGSAVEEGGGGGVGCTLPDTAPPPPAGADATEGSPLANWVSLLCHACLVARPNRPRITTRPMPTIATSTAYSDSACPRRFRVERVRLVSTTDAPREGCCGKRRVQRGWQRSRTLRARPRGVPGVPGLLYCGQAVM